MSARGVLLAGLTALIVLAPLPFGSVEPQWSALLAGASLALGLFWMIGRARRGAAVLPWREPLFVAAAAFAAVGLAQIVPMPSAALEVVSPRAAELRAELEPAAGPVIPEGMETFIAEDGAPAAGSSPGPGTRKIAGASTAPETGATGISGAEGSPLRLRLESARPVSLYPWGTLQSLLRFVSCAIIALVALDLASAAPARRVLIGALVASGAFQAFYGLAEYLSGRQHIFGYEKKVYADMATGTFINKNHYAGYLEMILPLALVLAISLFPRVRPSEHVPLARRVAELPGRDIFRASMVLLLAVLMGTAIAASQSKAGIACAGAGVLLTGLLLFLRGARAAAVLACAAAIAATVFVFTQDKGDLIVERYVQAPETFTGVVGRWPIWTQAAGVVSAFPLVGAGLGSFQYVFPAFRTRDAGVFLAHAHNDYLELAAEAGAVGVFVFAAGAVWLLWTLSDRLSVREGFGPFGIAAAAGVAAMALHSIIDFNMAIPANALTLAVLTGILVAWRRGEIATAPAPAARQGAWMARASVPAMVIAAVAALAVAPVAAGGMQEEAEDAQALPPVPPGGDSALRSLARLVDGGNAGRLFVEAAAAARTATADLQRLNEIALAEGSAPDSEVRAAKELLAEALRLQNEGIRLAPTWPKGHLYKGHIEAALCATVALDGGEQEACVRAGVRSFDAALRLNPMSAAMHAKVARFYIRAWPILDEGLRREALAVIEKAAAMNAADGMLQAALASARQEAPSGS